MTNKLDYPFNSEDYKIFIDNNRDLFGIYLKNQNFQDLNSYYKEITPYRYNYIPEYIIYNILKINNEKNIENLERKINNKLQNKISIIDRTINYKLQLYINIIKICCIIIIFLIIYKF